jgi:hypothetical protein
MPVYTNPTIDQDVSPKAVFYLDNKCAIFTCNASPEGVILANTGSIAISDNGSIYKKTTDDLTTGWVELASGTVSSPLNISGTNPTLNFIDTDVGDDDASFGLQTDILTLTIGSGTIVFRNNGQIAGYSKCVQSDVTTVGNVGAGATTLHTFSLPAASLLVDNDYVHRVHSGFFAANDNQKSIDIQIDGQSVFTTGAFDFDGVGGNANWSVELWHTRLSATTVRTAIIATYGQATADGASAFAGNCVITGRNIVTTTVANLGTNAINLSIVAIGTANNDIVQNLSIIELTQR